MMLRQINFLYNNNSGQGSTYLYTLDIRELHLAPVDMDVSHGHDLSGRVTSELDQHHHIRTIQVSLDSLLLCWIQTIIHFLQFDQIKYEKMWYSFPSLSATYIKLFNVSFFLFNTSHGRGGCNKLVFLLHVYPKNTSNLDNQVSLF